MPSLLVPAALALACGSSDSRRPPSTGLLDAPELTSISQFDSLDPDERDEFASGSCGAGAVQECRIYLPAHNGVQPCFVGEQYCEEGSWSDCLDPELVDAGDGDALLSLADLGE